MNNEAAINYSGTIETAPAVHHDHHPSGVVHIEVYLQYGPQNDF